MSFEEIYQKMFPVIIRYCYYQNNRNLFFAQEVTSETFMILWQKWDQLKTHDEKYLVAWLFGVVENKSKELYRRNLPQCESYETVEEYLNQQLNEFEFSYQESVKFRMYIQEIEKHLAPKDKFLFHGIVADSLSYKEISKRMNLSENAIKLRWMRLKDKLKPLVDKILTDQK